jgi:hypothetical protein
MSDRYKPKDLYRAAKNRPVDPAARFEPREQVVYRDGKKTTLLPMLCRLHNLPWMTCPHCSKVKTR